MAREADTDYNPAIRKEVKADADTGRTFKKYKHRAQGAAIGSAGTVAAILARKPLARAGRAILRKFSNPADMVVGFTARNSDGILSHFDDGDSDSDTFTGSVKRGAGLAAGAGAAYGAYKGVKAGAKAIGNSAVYTAAKKKAAGLIGKAGLVGSFLSMGEILGVTEFDGGYRGAEVSRVKADGKVIGYGAKAKKEPGVKGFLKRHAGAAIGAAAGAAGMIKHRKVTSIDQHNVRRYHHEVKTSHPKEHASGAAAGALGGIVVDKVRGGVNRYNEAGKGIGKEWAKDHKVTVERGSDMAAILGVTDFSLGGFQEMLESSVRLKKAHLRTFKKMTPDQRSKQQHEMRIHRDALNDIQTASDRSGGGYSPSYYSARQVTTDFASGDAMNCCHPKDLPMDMATLKRKKLNVGQTGPQMPLEPQDPIVKIKGMDGKMRFSRADLSFTNFAADQNGKLHSGSGEFEPEGGQITPQSIQRAYSSNRLTGRPQSAVKNSIKRTIMKRALARVGQLTEL